jgi:hypothetical protein
MGVPQTPSVLPVKHTIMKTQKISLWLLWPFLNMRQSWKCSLLVEISRRSASTSNLPCVIIEEENQKKKKS